MLFICSSVDGHLWASVNNAAMNLAFKYLFESLFSFYWSIDWFLDRREGREKERERNINVWLLLTCCVLGTWPPTQACALPGNWTNDLLVHRLALNPLSHTSQGWVPLFCFFGYVPKSGIARLYYNSVFNFLRHCPTVFHNIRTILHSHQQCFKDSSLFTSLLTLVYDVEHLFMCILPLIISSLKKCLFMSFVYF